LDIIRKDVTLETLGLDKEILYPLDFSKVAYYKISLYDVRPGGHWDGVYHSPEWEGIKYEVVYSPPDRKSANRELEKIKNISGAYTQRLREHIIGIRDDSHPLIYKGFYRNLGHFSFDCKRGFKERIFTSNSKDRSPIAPETESFVDRLNLFVKTVNSSWRNRVYFHKIVGVLNVVVKRLNLITIRNMTYADVESYHIHHYPNGLCELHQTTVNHNHDWLFEIFLCADDSLKFPSHLRKSLINQERFLEGEIIDYYINKYKTDTLSTFQLWLESVRHVYRQEAPTLDNTRFIDHFILRYDNNSQPIIDVYYRKKGQEGRENSDFDIKEYHPSPLNFMGLVSLIVKIMFFQQKYTYHVIPDDSEIRLDDWSPEIDWVPYPVSIRKMNIRFILDIIYVIGLKSLYVKIMRFFKK